MVNFLKAVGAIEGEDTKTALAKRYAQTIYPDLADQPLTPAKQGNEYFTFLANDEVIRIARNQGVADNMGREAALQELFTGQFSEARTADITDFQPDNFCMRMRKLEGEPLTASLIETLPLHEQAAVALKLGTFIKELHGITPSDTSHLPPSDEMKTRLLGKIDGLEQRGDSQLDPQRLKQARSYVENQDQLPDTKAMIHGDLAPDNILYDPKTGSLGIIDFNNTKTAYRHQEFAVMAHFYPEKFVHSVIDSYQKDRPSPDLKGLVRTGMDVMSITHNNTAQDSYKLPTPGQLKR